MSVENAKNPNAMQAIQSPVADIPKVEQPTAQEEILPEERKQVEKTILDTLEINSIENLDNFDEKLKEATKSLPRYQQIEKKLKSVDQQNLPYELFKVLKKDSDEEHIESGTPRDGVLISSMKHGRLECAGRTLVASIFLQEHGINHTAVSAPGHTFLVIEQSSDTLVYFDANNNLFFTFPMSTLEGYKGTELSSECRLKEYIPRTADFADGVNTVFSHFVAMPAKEAVGRQYLGNVAAALNGNKEFETTGIAVDKKAAERVHQIEDEIYGENKTLSNFYERVGRLIENEEIQTADDKRIIGEILKTHSSHDDFVNFFITVLSGNIGNRVPYVKNALNEQKRSYAEKVWNFLQKRSVSEAIRGR